MHNNIMTAGSRDCPLMLASGRYAQWRSRFLRYIDTRSKWYALRIKRSDSFVLTEMEMKYTQLLDACQTLKKCGKHRKDFNKIQGNRSMPNNHTTFESASEEDSDPEQAQKDKDMQKNLALIAKYFKKLYKPTNNNIRTSSNTRNKNVDTTLRNVVIMLRNAEKPKWVKDSTYHKEKMLLCKQAEKGVQLLMETGDSNVIFDSPDMCNNDIQDDQNDVECDDERVALANLKLDVDENKKIQKQLKKANATLTQELTECKSILVKTIRTLEESNSIRDSCLVALQNK
ncbi:hypothetical protein Tco_0245987 [Tanacetum coccineum]